jgi:hypothetical protein
MTANQLKRGSPWIIFTLLVLGSTGCHRPGGVQADKAFEERDAPFYFEMGAQGLPQGGKWKSVPVVTDLNHDGHPDIAAHVRMGKGPRVFLGDGNGHWQEASEGLLMGETTCGGGIVSGDINRDGHPDLAVADHCHGLSVWLGDGSGHWQPVARGINSQAAQAEAGKKTDLNVFMGTEDLGIGDVDEDGFMDLVATGSDRGGFTVYLGDGSGHNWRQSPADGYDGLPGSSDPDAEDGQQGGWSQDMTLADIDGDGHLDVVASYFAGPRVWLGDGKAQWRSASRGLPHPLIGGIYQRLALADVNLDGRVDLVVANDINGVECFLQQPDGAWSAQPDPFPDLKGGAHAVGVVDLDQDTHPELLVAGTLSQAAEASRGLFVLSRDPGGHWHHRPGTRLPDSGLREIYGITAADLDTDGRVDLVVTTDDSLPRADASPGFLPLSARRGLQIWMNRHTTREENHHGKDAKKQRGAMVAVVGQSCDWRERVLSGGSC